MASIRVLRHIVWFACLGICLACHSKGQEATGQDKESRIRVFLQGSENQIDYFGKVLDQNGKPIDGAKVGLEIGKFSPNPIYDYVTVDKININTDKFGQFKLINKRGFSLTIINIIKNNYEYDENRAFLEKSNDANYRDHQKPKASNPATPAVFYMRKIGEPTFLFHGDGGFIFSAKDSGTEQAFDVIRRDDFKGNDLKTLMLAGDPLYPDLRAKATCDPNAGVWNVELLSGKPGDGLQVLDRKLYEAPLGGYSSSFSFQIRILGPNGWPLVTIPGNPSREIRLTYDLPRPDTQILYLYLRSREPALYTRLIFEYPRNVRPDYLPLGAKIDTNPYGERNLEQAVGLPVDVKLKIEEEIRSTFRNYGRPQKPDLPKLVREWERSRPLTEKLKDMFKR